MNLMDVEEFDAKLAELTGVSIEKVKEWKKKMPRKHSHSS